MDIEFYEIDRADRDMSEIKKPDYRDEKFNIASFLPYMASLMPHRRAVIYPASRDAAGRVAYAHLTFAQLNHECDRYADGLYRYGIRKGVKTLLMVRPSLEFIALAFALFKTGAVPILIDPGMGVMNVLKCVAGVGPEAVVAVPEVHAAKTLLGWYFRSVKYSVIVGKNWLWRGITLDNIKKHGRAPFETVETAGSDPAAILFTSGSTGPAKGVLYEHRMFGAQVELLREAYKFEDGEMELPGFPLFALFNVALGMSCCIPDMDPTRPAQVDPAKIAGAIIDQGVTNTFGSPAIWNRVADYCNERGVKLNSIKRILIAGAPVSGELIERVKRMLPDGADVHTPYGATESLPLCDICGNDILRKGWPETRKGAGILVGKPVPPNAVKIIKITDSPIDRFDDSMVPGPGEIGEIIASGPVVTKEYYANPKATALAKVRDASGALWHRMGDAGYIDAEGDLWFCGRKDHRVESAGGKVYFSVKCEAIFNNHPRVYRSALAGRGKRPDQTPVMFVEPRPGEFPKTAAQKEIFIKELLELAKSSELTAEIGEIFFIEKMPVDVRHNAKIFREKLSAMASGGRI